MSIPICPKHNKSFIEIYPKKDKKLVRFECGCILYKDGEWKNARPE